MLCREPTEYPESVKGITLCPVCEWQEAQRTARLSDHQVAQVNRVGNVPEAQFEAEVESD